MKKIIAQVAKWLQLSEDTTIAVTALVVAGTALLIKALLQAMVR